MNTVLKEHHLVLPTYLVMIVKKFGLNFDDFILLTYFWNYKEETFDVNIVTKVLKLKENEILTSFNTLLSKNLIRINTMKDGNGKRVEVVDLDPLYQEIDMMFQEEKKEEESKDVYSIFESEFGRRRWRGI